MLFAPFPTVPLAETMSCKMWACPCCIIAQDASKHSAVLSREKQLREQTFMIVTEILSAKLPKEQIFCA